VSQIEDPRAAIRDLSSRLEQARSFLDLEAKAEELGELRREAGSPELWSNPDHAREVTRKLARYEKLFERVEGLEQSLEDAEVLLELAGEEEDESARSDVIEELEGIETDLAAIEIESLYFGEYDDHAAIISINAGAGGVDAQDWAEILLRMYVRFLEKSGLTFSIEDISPGDEAGIKSVTVTVEGDFAYGTLESERGVHRLVRISPFDSQSRRHTSFAGVDVIPQLDDADEIEINPEDLRIETVRSSGAGGQHVNVTDSAVRITHLPTGIVVGSQAERSQIQNRARAMALLRARLADVVRQERADQIDEIRGEQTEAAWGQQIRSYVMQPYQMVKDLRTNREVGNVQGVLDGDELGQLVESYLHHRRQSTQ